MNTPIFARRSLQALSSNVFSEAKVSRGCLATGPTSGFVSQPTVSPSLRSHSSTHLPLDLHPEVEEALARQRPVLALETAIVTHGLPHPTSVDLALDLEAIVRRAWVVPAHIALLSGRIKVGLSPSQLQLLADPKTKPIKLGRRDLPPSVVQRLTGGMTVSATMSIANLVGIKVFATGGIGGVHHEAHRTMDISSDLTELSRTPVAVVCAGVKSILDIGLTLEYLETMGVPVITLGDTKDFPAFYVPKSGHQVPFSTTCEAECAQIIYTADAMGLSTGTLIGVPIPQEFHGDSQTIHDAVERAVTESRKLGTNQRGKEVTPWLLNRVRELSAGCSVKANIALIKNNVSKAIQIATCYNRLIRQGTSSCHEPLKASSPSGSLDPLCATKLDLVPAHSSPSRILVVGAAAVDITSRTSASQKNFVDGSTGAGSVSFSVGGVAHNVALALHKLGVRDTVLVSSAGVDCTLSTFIIDQMKRGGLPTDGVLKSPNNKASVVNMVLSSDGQLLGGVADTDPVEQMAGEEISELVRKKAPQWVCLDCNLSSEAMAHVLETCRALSIPTAIEPTSINKCTRILPCLAKLCASPPTALKPLSLMFPNSSELEAIYQAIRRDDAPPIFSSLAWFQAVDALGIDDRFRQLLRRCLPAWATDSGIIQMSLTLLPAIGTMVVKRGECGVVVFGRLSSAFQGSLPDGWLVSSGGLMVKHYPAPLLKPSPGFSHGHGVTGAGDTLCGAVLASILDGGKVDSPQDWDRMIDLAQCAAVLTLQSQESVGNISDLGKRLQHM